MTEQIERLYQSLLEDCARANARDTLTLVKKACDSQVERGSSDFSVATIVRILAPDGPSESTVRNKQGERYRALISAYNTEYGLRITKKKKDVKDDWVERIEQPDVKWLVRDLIAENKRLKTELRQIKAIIKQEGKIQIDMREAVDAIPQSTPQLEGIEQNTLSAFITPEHLKASNMSFDKHGRLLGQNGEQLSGPKFEQAIMKMLTVTTS